MNRQYHISLRDEFDDKDCDGTKYIVLLDDGYPVGTCRFYELEKDSVILGRVVILPEYRGRKLGTLVVKEAEKWIAESGYSKIIVDSRLEAVEFYEKLGYLHECNEVTRNGVFDCIRMVKTISPFLT